MFHVPGFMFYVLGLMLKNLLKESIKIAAILAIAVPVFAVIAAWQGPKGAPPTENAPAPVNVGAADQVKEGGLSVGTFVSRLQTLLAKDSGNVGIGMDGEGKLPEAKLHVDGGAIFEGNIQVKSGLPEKDKVLTAVDDTGLASWKRVTADMLVPQGYEEVFFNAGEDIYGAWSVHSGRIQDSCNGDEGLAIGRPFTTGEYVCDVAESRLCRDVAVGKCEFEINGQCRIGGERLTRAVECRAAKILRKNEWVYETKTFTGKAVVSAIDHHGDHEYCRVDVNIPALGFNKTNIQSESQGSLEWYECRDWLLREISADHIFPLGFIQEKKVKFEGSWDIGPIEPSFPPNYGVTCIDGCYGEWGPLGTGNLNVTFTIIK